MTIAEYLEWTQILCAFALIPNQCASILSKNSTVIENPDLSPITESILHRGQRAVVSTPSTKSIHSRISFGGKIERQ
jgi:hypothetical protein